jgi:hypothetical protein
MTGRKNRPESCDIVHRSLEKEEVDIRLTSGVDSMMVVVVALFMVARKSQNPVSPKGRATTHFRMTAWLGWRRNEARYHRWPGVGGTIGVRLSTCGKAGSSGSGRWYAASTCSYLEMTTMWWRCSAAVRWRKEDSAVLQNWRKGSGGLWHSTRRAAGEEGWGSGMAARRVEGEGGLPAPTAAR